MTITISRRMLFAVVWVLVLCVLYAPKRQRKTVPPMPAAEPIPGIDWSQHQPPKREDFNYIDIEAEETF